MKTIFVGALLLCSGLASAQTVNYNGLGRMYIIDDHFKGNQIDGDSLSPSSGTSGYILFDLGVNIHPSDALKASAVLRSRTEFGGFFGDGSSFEFRQFNVSGILGKGNKGVKYAIGDLDLQMSEYTLFNNQESYNEYEADAFALRRDIVNYENFNFGNNWRLQGVNLSTSLDFDNVIERADLQLFGTRSKNSATFQHPDRFLIGGKIDLVKDEKLTVSGNAIQLMDALNTADVASSEYRNSVVTGKIGYNRPLGDNKFTFDAESGISSFSYTEVTNTSSSSSDYFYNIKSAFELSKSNVKVSLAYRNVGYDFISAGAQTRRIHDNGVPSVFGSVQQNTAFRNPSIFDRYSQEGLYNQTLSPSLMYYNPRYNLVTPYGTATPNRKGLTIGLSSVDAKKWYDYSLNAQLLSEVVGEGVTDLRSFTSLGGGTRLKVGKLMDKSKDIDIVIGGRFEQSSRADALVDFSSLILDAGIDVEVVKNLYLQVGYKALSSNGSEMIGLRDEFNDITSYIEYSAAESNSNIDESVLSLGVKFHFGKYSVFSYNAHLSNLTNADNSAVNNNIQEHFFGYTLKF